MAKVDYHKVEAALIDGMRRAALDRLHEEASKARRRQRRDFRYEGWEQKDSETEGVESEEVETEEEANESQAEEQKESRVSFLKKIIAEIDRLYIRDKGIYRKLRFPYRHLQYAIVMCNKLPPEQWAKVLELQARIKMYKKENPYKNEDGEVISEDEGIVDAERERSRDLRFNVKKNWLPS